MPTEPEFIDPLPDEDEELDDYDYDDYGSLECGCCSCCGCDNACGYWDYDYDEELED